jgi:hypothetical protein
MRLAHAHLARTAELGSATADGERDAGGAMMARPKGFPLRASVTVLGVAGFLGLLIAAHFAPSSATLLQGLSLAWFLVFGTLRFAWRK